MIRPQKNETLTSLIRIHAIGPPMVRHTAKAGPAHKVETDYADPFIGPAAVRFKVTLFL
jgi:hypothetical protein